MFKDYIYNHPDSKLAYLFNEHGKFDIIRKKYTQKAAKTLNFLLASSITIVLLTTIAYFLTGSLFFPAVISIFILLFFSVPYSEKHVEFTISQKYDDFLNDIYPTFQHKNNVAILLKELEDIQLSLKLIELEKIIFDLKIIYVEDKGINRKFSSDLMHFIYKNYEDVKDISYLKKDDLSILGLYEKEIEIGMTNAQRIL